MEARYYQVLPVIPGTTGQAISEQNPESPAISGYLIRGLVLEGTDCSVCVWLIQGRIIRENYPARWLFTMLDIWETSPWYVITSSRIRSLLFAKADPSVANSQ
eukprot:135649-Amorphochlora_amoeboformis.AAC.1